MPITQMYIITSPLCNMYSLKIILTVYQHIHNNFMTNVYCKRISKAQFSLLLFLGNWRTASLVNVNKVTC